MPSRLPRKGDFPSTVTLDIIPPSPNQKPVNILILLHGLGDTHVPFTRLASQLNLPETCCISIRGFHPIPGLFLGSDAAAFHWGDDVLFDQTSGEIELDAGFNKSKTVLLQDVLQKGLFENCGYSYRDVLFYGFGQGGMLALSAVAEQHREFGGVVSVGGSLPSAAIISAAGKLKTPIIVCGGSKSREITRSKVDSLKHHFESVEYVKWNKTDDSMPKSRDEMLPIMKFFARRLRSRAGVPEGAVEI